MEARHNWDVHHFSVDVSADPVSRNGLTVGAGCRLDDDDWFLPERLWVGAGVANAGYSVTGPYGSVTPGPLWYQPQVFYYSAFGHTSATSYVNPCEWQETYQHWTSLFYFGLESGSSYRATP